MKKKPVPVNIPELEEILSRYLTAGPGLNYAVKILGHPGVGKSAIVKAAAESMNYYFIDTRLAFKENVDLGGYPVPDHDNRRMIYYRPKFIPPETVPEGYDGILWFLDESNRAHPTVIQTLFQIITEHICGEHLLPDKTSIVLAGNLGEADNTTITDFDDAALDGRLAIFHLKPAAGDWLTWACKNNIHPSIVRYVSLFPERLWDEEHVNPNPRGWHQASLAITRSYGLPGDDELAAHLNDEGNSTLGPVLNALLGTVAGSDFISEISSPRELSTADILKGAEEKLERVSNGSLPAEDLLWSLTGAMTHFRELNILRKGNLSDEELGSLANTLLFINAARADTRSSFFYLLIRDCGIFSIVPRAIQKIDGEQKRKEVTEHFSHFLEG